MSAITTAQTGNEAIVHQFIAAANRFDTEAILSMFATDAVIEDVSVGENYEQLEGIKKYFVTFFIGYRTSTKLLSIAHTAPGKILAKVDFTGVFGHETGRLAILFSSAGLIDHIEAYLD